MQGILKQSQFLFQISQETLSFRTPKGNSEGYTLTHPQVTLKLIIPKVFKRYFPQANCLSNSRRTHNDKIGAQIILNIGKQDIGRPLIWLQTPEPFMNTNELPRFNNKSKVNSYLSANMKYMRSVVTAFFPVFSCVLLEKE